jgi:hypothetical protein
MLDHGSETITRRRGVIGKTEQRSEIKAASALV